MTEIDDELIDTETAEAGDVPVARPKAAPIESRFLFVDVAAMRAKQLRRGALPRLGDDVEIPVEPVRIQPKKAERVAMEEVRRGLVLYEVPPLPRKAEEA